MGPVLTFGGTNEAVQFPNNALHDLGTNLHTWTAWIKTSSTARQTFVRKRTSGGIGSGFDVMNGGGVVRLFEDGASNSTQLDGATAVNNGAWHFICGLRTSSTTMAVYVDGVLDGSPGTNANPGSLTASDGIKIGASASTNWFVGSIKDVRLYMRALSAAEIAAMYHPETRWDLYKQPRIMVAAPSSALTHYTLDASPGTYNILGSASGLRAARKIDAVTGVYVLTGVSVALRRALKLPAVPGTYSLSGSTANMRADRKLAAVPGSYTITGVAAALRRGFLLAAAPGAYVITGVAASLRRAARLAAVPGTYSITGTAATLRSARRLAAESGVYVVTGIAASLRRGFRLVADPGAYVITGVAASLRRGLRLLADPGVYTLTGTAASLRRGFRLVADPGIYVVTGVAAGLRAARRLHAQAGTYAVIGAAAELVYSNVVAVIQHYIPSYRPRRR
jgi:hypothetical protein